VIFLRNVLIYFEPATKLRIVDALLQRLAPDGRLVVGHAESLTGLCPHLASESPGVYRRRPS
jgi:chemotaxis protein methyltransferase CheR